MIWEKRDLDNTSFYSSTFFSLAGLAQTGFGIFWIIFLFQTPELKFFFVDFAPQWELWTAISIRACVFIFFSEKVSSCETIHSNSVVSSSFGDLKKNPYKKIQKLQFGELFSYEIIFWPKNGKNSAIKNMDAWLPQSIALYRGT